MLLNLKRNQQVNPAKAQEIILSLPADKAKEVMAIGKELCMPMSKEELNKWRQLFWGHEGGWDAIRKDR